MHDKAESIDGQWLRVRGDSKASSRVSSLPRWIVSVKLQSSAVVSVKRSISTAKKRHSFAGGRYYLVDSPVPAWSETATSQREGSFN